MKVRKVFWLLLFFLSACQSVSEKPDNVTYCAEERPEVCTMIYDPVCGVGKDNQSKTYASDCTACSHAEVVGYVKGDCDRMNLEKRNNNR